MKKPAQVVMLATDKKAITGSIVKTKTSLQLVTNNNISAKDRETLDTLEVIELYILSDDKIEEKAWKYNEKLNCITQHLRQNKGLSDTLLKASDYCKKIIASTHKNLTIKHNCDCMATTFEGCSQCIERISQVPLQFIELFIAEYNKGHIITEVEVEYEEYLDTTYSDHGAYKNKLLINKNNTINISLPVKNNISDLTKAIEKIKKGNYGSAINFIERYINTEGYK